MNLFLCQKYVNITSTYSQIFIPQLILIYLESLPGTGVAHKGIVKVVRHLNCSPENFPVAWEN